MRKRTGLAERAQVVGADAPSRAAAKRQARSTSAAILTLARAESELDPLAASPWRATMPGRRATALTVEAWQAINRAWLIVREPHQPGGVQATLNLVDRLKAEIRGFEGRWADAAQRRRWFMHLGSAIERGDNTARLLDVKYYLLLPPGQEGGRHARPRPMVDPAPDRLGRDRLSPHLSRGRSSPGWSPTA
jgi:uncharacterized alpha-E superfamily protein